MATQADELMDETENAVDAGEVEQQPDEQPQGEVDDEVLIGDERASAEEEPEGMRNLRTRLREVERRNRELEGQHKPTTDIGPKPNRDDYWDREEADYDRDLLAWNEAKRAADEAKNAGEAAAKRQQERWDRQYGEFEQSWGDLRLTGKDAIRAAVEDNFTATQQALLIKASRGSATGLFARLGTRPDDLAKLKALVDDPVEFTAEAAVMASGVTVGKRKPTTTPETVHGGSSPSGGGNTLERLEAAARKTGDWTPVFAYKRKNNA